MAVVAESSLIANIEDQRASEKQHSAGRSSSILAHNAKTTGRSRKSIPSTTPTDQQAQQRVAYLLKHWPSDPVRPASVSVQSYLQSHLSRPSKSPDKSQQQSTAPISESSLNALSSLVSNRYARRYPLAPRLRRPQSNPDHYDNVVKEFAEAPTRDWWGRLSKRLGGLFRFK